MCGLRRRRRLRDSISNQNIRIVYLVMKLTLSIMLTKFTYYLLVNSCFFLFNFQSDYASPKKASRMDSFEKWLASHVDSTLCFVNTLKYSRAVGLHR